MRHSGVYSKTEFPVVLYDHPGFASGVDDGEPSIAWPAAVEAYDWDAEAVEMAGPPLYGVPVKITRVAWR